MRGHPRPGDQCDLTCTVDCGHCKGAGTPLVAGRSYAALYQEDGGFRQVAVVSAEGARDMIARSTDPSRLKFQEL